MSATPREIYWAEVQAKMDQEAVIDKRARAYATASIQDQKADLEALAELRRVLAFLIAEGSK